MGWQRVWAVPQDTLVGDLGGSLPAQFRVWPDGVAIVLPRSEPEPGINGAATNCEIRDSDNETVGQRIVSPVKKRVESPRHSFGTEARGSQLGLNATAAHSRKAGYICADWHRQHQSTLKWTGRVIHF